MRHWPSSPDKTKQVTINLAGGLNQDESMNLKDGECTSVVNMDSSLYDVLSVRDGRSLYAAHTGYINRLFMFKGQMYAGNGKGLYKWSGSAWSAVYEYADINDNRLWDAAQFFDGSKLYFIDGSLQLRQYDGTTLTTLGSAPISSFLTTHSNRFFLANPNDNLLSFSGLRDAADWSSTDQYVGSGKITVETGDGEKPTGLINFGGHVILFKKYSFHELYGDDATNFEMSDPYKYGCVSDRTIVETPVGLIWLGTDRVNLYKGGGAPQDIANVKIRNYIKSLNIANAKHCVAGTDGRFYYLSLVTGENTLPNVTLKFDLDTGRWWVEDFIATSYYLDGNTLYMAINGSIFKMEGSTDNGSAISWSAEYFFADGGGIYPSTMHKMYLVADIESGSIVNVHYSTDPEGSEWTQVGSTISPTGTLQNVKIPIIVSKPSEWFRIKISGTGKAKFYRLIREVARRGA